MTIYVKGATLALPTASSGERRTHSSDERKLRRSEGSGMLIGDPLRRGEQCWLDQQSHEEVMIRTYRISQGFADQNHSLHFTFFLLSHHHSTSALVSEILMSVLQTVQKNKNNNSLHMDRQCKKTTIYRWTDSAKKQQRFTYGQTVQKKTTNNLRMDRQCKKTTAIYIWTVHIYRLYRRQCAKYTYIYSVHIVYYKDTLNYQRHIIHRMGTSTLCTVSVHNVVHT